MTSGNADTPARTSTRFDAGGAELIPGHNLDRVDVAAGMLMAAFVGFKDAQSQMVVEYALVRHARGEEKEAQATALSGGIHLTGWYMILARAITAADAAAQ